MMSIVPWDCIDYISLKKNLGSGMFLSWFLGLCFGNVQEFSSLLSLIFNFCILYLLSFRILLLCITVNVARPCVCGSLLQLFVSLCEVRLESCSFRLAQSLILVLCLLSLVCLHPRFPVFSQSESMCVFFCDSSLSCLSVYLTFFIPAHLPVLFSQSVSCALRSVCFPCLPGIPSCYPVYSSPRFSSVPCHVVSLRESPPVMFPPVLCVPCFAPQFLVPCNIHAFPCQEFNVLYFSVQFRFCLWSPALGSSSCLPHSQTLTLFPFLDL